MNDTDEVSQNVGAIELAGPLTIAKQPENLLPLAVPEKQALTAQQARVVEVTEALTPAYQKASTLELSEKEIAELTAPFPDTCIEIRPHDGLIYLPHIFVSQRLNKVFGPGKWAMVRRWEKFERGVMYGEYVLLIRGCYVGESIGGHPYVSTNPKTNYSDALESTAAEALRRIAGKRLSCGEQCWEPEYARQWVAKYAEQVGGKWRKKQVAAPAPAKTASPPKPAAPVESDEEKKSRFIKLCIEAGGGSGDFARALFTEMGWIMENEDLADISTTLLPKTKREAENILCEIRTRAGVETPEHADPEDSPTSDAPPDSRPRVSGYCKLVNQKKGTSKKGEWVCYSVLVVQNMDDREGGVWLATFDRKLGAKAEGMKGQYGTFVYEEGEKGNNLQDIEQQGAD